MPGDAILICWQAQHETHEDRDARPGSTCIYSGLRQVVWAYPTCEYCVNGAIGRTGTSCPVLDAEFQPSLVLTLHSSIYIRINIYRVPAFETSSSAGRSFFTSSFRDR